MKKNILLVLSAVLLFSSCGLLLGPVSELSLVQRLSKGWKVIYEFTTASPIYTDLNSTKLLIGKSQNELRCYYFIGSGATRYLYYFTTNSYGISISPLLAAAMPNKFDLSYDNSNSSLIYGDGGNTITHFFNGVSNVWSFAGIIMGGSSTLVAQTNKLIGLSMSAPGSAIAEVTFGDSSATNITSFPNASGINNFYKCRNQYSSDTVIAITYWDSTNMVNQFELLSLNSFNNFMLGSPFSLTNPGSSPVVESDGASRLYMVYNNNIYRYDGVVKSFISDYTLPYTFTTGLSNFITSPTFVSDNFLIVRYNGQISNSSVLLWSYNTTARTLNENKFIDTTPSEQLVGMDMYYDPSSYSLYIGVLFYNTNNNNLHGMLYKNQM